MYSTNSRHVSRAGTVYGLPALLHLAVVVPLGCGRAARRALENDRKDDPWPLSVSRVRVRRRRGLTYAVSWSRRACNAQCAPGRRSSRPRAPKLSAAARLVPAGGSQSAVCCLLGALARPPFRPPLHLAPGSDLSRKLLARRVRLARRSGSFGRPRRGSLIGGGGQLGGGQLGGGELGGGCGLLCGNFFRFQSGTGGYGLGRNGRRW